MKTQLNLGIVGACGHGAGFKTMLCKMRSGGLVKIRVDMVSDRPHNMVNYQRQANDGCYESDRHARGHGYDLTGVDQPAIHFEARPAFRTLRYSVS